MSRKRFSKKEKALIAERAFHRCEYCQWFRKFTNGFFEKEHIIPLIKDGVDDLYNIAYSCQPCNNAKSDQVEGYDELTETIVPLYNPRIHNWLEHFRWNEDYTLIIGTTPIGRVTVTILRMNREDLILLRGIFRDVSDHPPMEY